MLFEMEHEATDGKNLLRERSEDAAQQQVVLALSRLNLRERTTLEEAGVDETTSLVNILSFLARRLEENDKLAEKLDALTRENLKSTDSRLLQHRKELDARDRKIKKYEKLIDFMLLRTETPGGELAPNHENFEALAEHELSADLAALRSSSRANSDLVLFNVFHAGREWKEKYETLFAQHESLRKTLPDLKQKGKADKVSVAFPVVRLPGPRESDSDASSDSSSDSDSSSGSSSASAYTESLGGGSSTNLERSRTGSSGESRQGLGNYGGLVTAMEDTPMVDANVISRDAFIALLNYRQHTEHYTDLEEYDTRQISFGYDVRCWLHAAESNPKLITCLSENVRAKDYLPLHVNGPDFSICAHTIKSFYNMFPSRRSKTENPTNHEKGLFMSALYLAFLGYDSNIVKHVSYGQSSKCTAGHPRTKRIVVKTKEKHTKDNVKTPQPKKDQDTNTDDGIATSIATDITN